MNFRTKIAIFAALALAAMPLGARADYTTRDGLGNVITIKSFTVGGAVAPQATPVDQFGNAYNVSNPLPTAAGSSALAGMVSISATSTSSNVALPQLATSYPTITLYNAGPKDVFFAQGTASVTASTSSTRIPAGVPITVAVGGFPYVAAITSGSDTATLLIYQATGPIYFGAGAATGGGGTGGSSSTFNAAFPTTGTAIGMAVGGNMVPFTGTGGNVNVQCANCSGSGASAIDQATFAFGGSVFAAGGGVFQTVPSSNPLVSGQQGAFQVTATRSLFTNLRNAGGTEVGASGSPLFVTGSGGTFPISGNVGITGTLPAFAAIPTFTINQGTPGTTNAVSASQAGNWSVRAQDGAGNALTSVLRGAQQALSTQIVDGSGNQITTFGGTSSAFGSTFPANGTAGGMSQGGNMVALTGTSGNLNVQCANCSGSGVVTTDAAAFTASSSLFAGSGGFFQTTATSNPLTTGQQGMFQVTANRALFTNLRNAAGTEVGTSSTPLQVTGANGTFVTTIADGADIALGAKGEPACVTGNGSCSLIALQKFANITAPVLGAGAAVIGSLTANQTVNVAQINGITPLMGNGVTGTGSQRVTIASDNTAFSVNAVQSGTWTIQPGNTANTTPWLASISQGGNTAAVNASVADGASNTASGLQAYARMQMWNGTTWDRVPGDTTNGLWVNVKQALGITPTTATGTLTGSLVLGSVTTAAPTYTTGQIDRLNLTTAGALRTDNSTMGGVAVSTGNGVVGTGVQRVAIASDNTAFSVNAVQSGTWTMQPGNTANTTPWLVTPTPTAGKGCTPYHLANGTAVSTNSTSVKGSAGSLCKIGGMNTTATLVYIKVYDSASAPTCSSATGLKHVFPVPSGTTGAGIFYDVPMNEAYPTGIGFCVTGGGADTDNSNAVTGIYIEGSYL